jgi:hypothetical protein
MATNKYKEYHCKNQVQKLKVESRQEGLGWKHNKSECVSQHPLLKKSSIKVNLHISEDQTIVHNTYIV